MISKKLKVLTSTMLTLALTATMFTNTVAMASSNDGITVNLTGMYTKSVEPDTAKISVDVFDRGETNQEVKENLINKVSEFKEALLNSEYQDSIGSITSNNFTISPDYDYETWTEIIGYSGYQDIYITVKDLNHLNEIVSLIADFETVESYYTQYDISDYENVYNEVLVMAIKNANEKAEKISEAFGYGEYEIEFIAESNSSLYNYGFGNNNYFRMEKGLEDANPDLNPSKISVSAEVNVSYKY